MEQSSEQSLTVDTPSQDASELASTPSQDPAELSQNSGMGYGFVRPSFSYLNAVNMVSGSSQKSSSSLAMQVDSPSSSASGQTMSSSLSMSTTPSFSYISSSKLISHNMATEQGQSGVWASASSAAPSMLSPVPLVTPLPHSFVPGNAVHPIGPPVSLPIVVADQNPSLTGNLSLDRSLHPNINDYSLRNDERADSSQEIITRNSAPPFALPSSKLSHTNSNPLSTHFISNSHSSSSAWMSAVPAFQVPTGMPRTPVTPGPPCTPPSVASNPSMTGQPSTMNSTALLRNFMPAAPLLSNPPIQHQAVTPYMSPSPQVAPPGMWLQPQQISGFVRPPFSQYPDVIPGPFPVLHCGMPPHPASSPEIQPPGVFHVVSSVGLSTPSVGHSVAGSVQTELPPGTDNSKHSCNVQMNDAVSSREHFDVWTTHLTETGTRYYYNVLTKESTYEKPSGFKGESDKSNVQTIPISWEKMAGTDWTLVTTNDRKTYYYNSTTQSSVWQIPSEVLELQKRQETDSLEAQPTPETNTNILTEKGQSSSILSAPGANTGARDTTALRRSSASASSSALDLIKKKLQDSGTPDTAVPGAALSTAMTLELNGSKSIEVTVKGPQNENNKDKRKDVNGNDNMSDSSSDSEDEDRGPTKEECVLQFKKMLKERGVVPFSKWERELPKIVFDPRFKAIPNHSSRRAIFDHYVRTRAEEERKEKRAAQKAASDGFKELLEEGKEDIDHNTNYESFKRKWGEDPRFQALDRKEREILLNERIIPLKKAARDKAHAERSAATSSFKSMLRENRAITSTTHWSKVKDSLKSDPRYKSVKHEDREKLFNEFVDDLKVAEEEIECKSKAKQEEEEKLKERERALRKRKEREEQEVERVRLKARRKEAVESYQALLVETIKDVRASWTESKPKLEKDPQGRAANPQLDKSDLEKHFREHVKSLHERCVVEFRALLTEFITTQAAAQESEEGKTVLSSWSTAKHLLKGDPRYKKIPRKERESQWRRHAEEIGRKQKSVDDPEPEKHGEARTRNTVDSGKHASGSRRTYDRR